MDIGLPRFYTHAKDTNAFIVVKDDKGLVADEYGNQLGYDLSKATLIGDGDTAVRWAKQDGAKVQVLKLTVEHIDTIDPNESDTWIADSMTPEDIMETQVRMDAKGIWINNTLITGSGRG
jgi:hypothetical protein